MAKTFISLDGKISKKQTLSPKAKQTKKNDIHARLYIPDIPEGFTVITDSREQIPYEFTYPDKLKKKTILKVSNARETLLTADYSIKGMEDQISIERKSQSDFYGSFFSKRRVNEVKKFQRMQDMAFRGIVIENTERNILEASYDFYAPNIERNSIKGTLIGIAVKWGVHVYFGNREECENQVLNWLVYYYNMQVKNNKMIDSIKSVKKGG